MKISLDIEMAKDTAKHNDRSMYHGHSPSKFESPDHAPNWHWDWCGTGDSVLSEQQFYEEKFGEILEEQNAKAKAKRMYSRIQTMDQYHEKHMPREMIIQLGNVDDQPPDDHFIRQMCDEIRQMLTDMGLEVISIDLHNDEATPHAHIRFIGIDEKGKSNLTGCLHEHGMFTPIAIAKEQLGIPAEKKDLDQDDLARIREIMPYMISERKKDGQLQINTRSNTHLTTMTSMIRDYLEDRAIEMGYPIDTVRQHRKALSISEYRREQERKRRDELVREQQQAITAEREQIAQEIRDINEDYAEQIEQAIDDTAQIALDELRITDLQGRPIDENWFENMFLHVETMDKSVYICQLYHEAQRQIKVILTQLQQDVQRVLGTVTRDQYRAAVAANNNRKSRIQQIKDQHRQNTTGRSNRPGNDRYR